MASFVLHCEILRYSLNTNIPCVIIVYKRCEVVVSSDDITACILKNNVSNLMSRAIIKYPTLTLPIQRADVNGPVEEV